LNVTTLLPIEQKRTDPERRPEAGLVSVIIPNYNHERYVSDAIQSVLQQTYRNVEIIVVDDGSTDGSRAVIAGFGDQVRYIWQENRGLSAARNTGIAVAAGAYIGLLDADDRVEPDYLQHLVAILAANPDTAAVYCGYRFVDQVNRPLPQIEVRPLPVDAVYNALLYGNFLVPEAMLVRRSCYTRVGPFDETLRACEDWDMWLRIAQNHPVLATDKILTRHRVLPESMSSDPVRMRTNRFAVLHKHFGPEQSNQQAWGAVQRHAYSHAYWCTAVEYLQHQAVDHAYQAVRRMVEINPDIVGELDIFYDLARGEQPKGNRGDLTTYDGQRNADLLIGMLDRLFAEPTLRHHLSSHKRLAYANAYWALGLLTYAARDLPKARRFLWLALVQQPRYVRNWKLISTLCKALVGAFGIDWLRAQKRV
jgi:tetratricopeptide (TPR) repeat protein